MMRTDTRPQADLTLAHRLAGTLRTGLTGVLRGKPEPVRLSVIASALAAVKSLPAPAVRS